MMSSVVYITNSYGWIEFNIEDFVKLENPLNYVLHYSVTISNLNDESTPHNSNASDDQQNNLLFHSTHMCVFNV